MAKLKNDTAIEFNGKLTGITIKVNGEIIYPLRDEYKEPEERSPNLSRAQKTHGVISSFASCVNKIPDLKTIWARSVFVKRPGGKLKPGTDDRRRMGKAMAFNKIMSANRRIKENFSHPTVDNLFVPSSFYSLPRYDALLLNDELNFVIEQENIAKSFFEPEEKYVTGAVIICPFDPKRKSRIKYDLFPKWTGLQKFLMTEQLQVSFIITPEERETIIKYKNCIVYFTLVTWRSESRIKKCFSQSGVEFSLSEYPLEPVQFHNGSQ